MPTIHFSDFDFYSLLDADTDEARTFTTYLGYWVSLADLVQRQYGDDYAPALVQELRSRKSFRSLSGRGPVKDPGAVRSLLLNGWTSELHLNLIDLSDGDRLVIANHGAPVDAYYATSRHATAWLMAHHSAAPTTHRGLLNAVSSLVHGSRYLPHPWDLACTAVYPSPDYAGFPEAPGRCSNLASVADPYACAAMILRTTRERGVRKKVEEVKATKKLARAPRGEAARQDDVMTVTTTFDFAWRMRTRSNYGDPAMFYVGTLGVERARAYAGAIRTWNGATMLLFEALIAQRAHAVVRDAAVHFVSRDRSGLAEQLIVPRLRCIGLLKSQ